MKTKKNKFDTKLIILSIVALITLIIYINDKYNYGNETIIEKQDNLLKTTDITNLNIYIYDSKYKNFIERKSSINSTRIVEGDYVDAIIKYLKLDPDKYKFLAAYNILEDKKNILIIKLSSHFNKLDNNNLNIFINSTTKTLMNNLENIDEIKIEIDTN